jgi:UDP-N-acetylmuramyl tripeptide synthase
VALPFEDSRRLQGANLFFATTGAVLEFVGAGADASLLAGWRARASRAAAALGWPVPPLVARPHAAGTALALGAPCDQLFLATEVNEWALCATLLERDPVGGAGLEAALAAAAAAAAADGTAPALAEPPVLEEAAALGRFRRLAAREANPRLRALVAGADARALPYAADELLLTLGSGARGADFPLGSLPAPEAVDWDALGAVPTALVTGSNGKTTSVRLLAACARAHGWRAAHNCTDGVFLGDEALARGDYSGPAGARLVVRDRRTEAAILETARGGILRRGIAVSRADVALVTNVSADHFGEYGIDDLGALADAKLTVAAALGPGGLLVLNAADPELRAAAAGLERRFGRRVRTGWFAAGDDAGLLARDRAGGAPTCGVEGGRLARRYGEATHDLGAVADMPLTLGGVAGYNVANLAGAALAAAALGIAPATIAAVFARFGARIADNPGRMMRFTVGGVTVLVDYAHNPDGLRGFLRVADHLRHGAGRLGVLLGHAGNRQDADIRALAQAAAAFRPEFVVVKENEAHLRGRAPGEIPHIIHHELRRLGIAESALATAPSELEGARAALAWARAGDVLALPVHSATARAAVVALLDPHA